MGDLSLTRWPVREADPLQAWDGADRYLLEALRERSIDGDVLVVDDAFGALGTALAGRARAWGDSELARLALTANLERTGRPEVPWTPMTQAPPGDVAAVVGRLPRSTRRLQWLLQQLSQVLPVGTPVLLSEKSKRVQKSMVAAVDAAIGSANSTLARHRARLVVAERDGRAAPVVAPRTWEVEPGLIVRGWPGVFGEERIDGGTALLLPAVPSGVSGTIVDLGCGAGPLGLVAAKRNPAAAIVFRDESHLAVASARRAFAQSGLTNRTRFEPADVLDGVPSESVDVVLCNPPFHQGQAVSRRVAAHMFKESARVLREGGRLLVVGNRHLAYHVALKGLFGAVQTRASDRRFVVLEAKR
jgi:23S rRNA (guanine1835-N2)-methyltransferase